MINKELKIWRSVNSCESFLGLSNIIKSLADENGMIQGRDMKFNAEKMSKYALNFIEYPPNALTREYGIRQQALYIKYYSK